jgi:hypothetical protein
MDSDAPTNSGLFLFPPGGHQGIHTLSINSTLLTLMSMPALCSPSVLVLRVPAALPAELKLLDISNCSMSGGFPDTSTSKKLYAVYAPFNKLSGPLPPRMSASMGVLDLSHNALSGPLEGAAWVEPTQLRAVSLADNQITGECGVCLGMGSGRGGQLCVWMCHLGEEGVRTMRNEDWQR